MDPKQDEQDRAFLEMTVTDLARRAVQLPPDERQAFIMGEIGKVSTIFDEKYGEHPNAGELDGKLRNWVRSFMWTLANPRGSYKPVPLPPGAQKPIT